VRVSLCRPDAGSRPSRPESRCDAGRFHDQHGSTDADPACRGRRRHHDRGARGRANARVHRRTPAHARRTPVALPAAHRRTLGGPHGTVVQLDRADDRRWETRRSNAGDHGRRRLVSRCGVGDRSAVAASRDRLRGCRRRCRLAHRPRRSSHPGPDPSRPPCVRSCGHTCGTRTDERNHRRRDHVATSGTVCGERPFLTPRRRHGGID
jgi:hypothetical protein